MRNPLFYQRQRMRASTWNVPRFLHSFDETIDGGLILPRGLIDTVAALAEEAGSNLEVTDERSAGTEQKFTFTGTLTGPHWEAVTDLASHEQSVLVAPQGSGQTVVACALMAEHATSTLILVDRKALAEQWRARVAEFLGVKVGQLGGGRAKLRGTVDVVTLQTLARRTDIGELTAGYGLVVADECHHVPAAAFDDAVKQIPARRWLGLTATPYRRDKLEDLIAWQVGPTRHAVASSRQRDQNLGRQELALPGVAPTAGTPGRFPCCTCTRPTTATAATPTRKHQAGWPRFTATWQATRTAPARSSQMCQHPLARGRHCLVLTLWIAHLQQLAEGLQAMGHDPVLLRGGMGARSRTSALARLQPQPGGRPLLVVATGPYAGEGFDCPITRHPVLGRPGQVGALSSTSGAFSAPTPARKPRRYTTATTRPRACSPRH